MIRRGEVQGWWRNPPGGFVLEDDSSVLVVGRGIIGFGGLVIALGRGIIGAGSLLLGVCGVGLREGRTIIKVGTVIIVLSRGIIGDVAGAGCEDKAAVQRNESKERNVMKTKSKAGGFVLPDLRDEPVAPRRVPQPRSEWQAFSTRYPKGSFDERAIWGRLPLPRPFSPSGLLEFLLL